MEGKAAGGSVGSGRKAEVLRALKGWEQRPKKRTRQKALEKIFRRECTLPSTIAAPATHRPLRLSGCGWEDSKHLACGDPSHLCPLPLPLFCSSLAEPSHASWPNKRSLEILFFPPPLPPLLPLPSSQQSVILTIPLVPSSIDTFSHFLHSIFSWPLPSHVLTFPTCCNHFLSSSHPLTPLFLSFPLPLYPPFSLLLLLALFSSSLEGFVIAIRDLIIQPPFSPPAGTRSSPAMSSSHMRQSGARLFYSTRLPLLPFLQLTDSLLPVALRSLPVASKPACAHGRLPNFDPPPVMTSRQTKQQDTYLRGGKITQGAARPNHG